MIIPIMMSTADFIVKKKTLFQINNAMNWRYGKKNEIAVKSW